MAKEGNAEEAKRIYKDILAKFPKNKRAQQGLANLNKPKQPTATQGPPQDTINQLLNLYNQGQLEVVVEQAKALTKQYPDAFVVWNILGAAHKGLGNNISASEAFNDLHPNYPDGFNNLGATLKDQGKLDEAIACYNKALSLKPEYAEASYNMGVVLHDQGKLDEAIACYNKALSLKPEYAEAYNNMGSTLQAQGKLEEAIVSVNKVLSLKPDYAEAHRNLSNLVKYQPDDAQITLVREMMQRSDLKDDDRCHLHYTLAKMSEDVGDLDIAYDHYVAGGKLRKKLLSYDFKQDELIFDQTKNTAPKYKGFSLDTPIETTTNTPVFILGMPRSGTTLVEQIISSHSQVHGAGELPFLDRFGGALSLGNQIISSENVLQMRNAYLHELEKVSSGCQFVTDKMLR